jgi:hypothetical protein
MRHGSAALFGVFAGDGEDLCDLLGGEPAWGTIPGQVAQQSLDGVRQSRPLLATFDQSQALESIGPSVPSWANRMTFASDLPGDVLVGEAIEAQEDHPCPLGNGLRTGTGTCHALEDRLLPFRDDAFACAPWH